MQLNSIFLLFTAKGFSVDVLAFPMHRHFNSGRIIAYLLNDINGIYLSSIEHFGRITSMNCIRPSIIPEISDAGARNY